MTSVKSADRIKHCVVISDLHFGCSFALAPSTPFILDTGVEYRPSKLQKEIYKHWRYFWDKWIPSKIGNDPFCLVINGDVIEGVHHRIVTQISQNISDHVRIAKAILGPVIKRAKKVFMIRGTEAHSGSSAQEEEKLAEDLQIDSIAPHSKTALELWLKLNGKIIHFCHHIGYFSSLSSEGTALFKETYETLAESSRWGFPIPSVIVRSHRHSFSEVSVPYKDNHIKAFVTPAWQLKTPFAYKISRAKTSSPQIGGSIITVENGEVVTNHLVVGIKSQKYIVSV